MLRELINFSNHLDDIGLEKEADYLDNLIKNAQWKEFRAPWEEIEDFAFPEGGREGFSCQEGFVMDPSTGECIDVRESCADGFVYDSTVEDCVEDPDWTPPETTVEPSGSGRRRSRRREPKEEEAAAEAASTNGLDPEGLDEAIEDDRLKSGQQAILDVKKYNEAVETNKSLLRSALGLNLFQRLPFARDLDVDDEESGQNAQAKLDAVISKLNAIELRSDSEAENNAVANVLSAAQMAYDSLSAWTRLAQAEQPEVVPEEVFARKENGLKKLAYLWPEVD